jgi:hypothetical protein
MTTNAIIALNIAIDLFMSNKIAVMVSNPSELAFVASKL